MRLQGIKIKPFNEAPTLKELGDYLDLTNLPEICEVADAKRQYWQNDQSTLVLRLVRNRGLTLNDIFALGELGRKFRADEFDSLVENYETYYRIWWD